MSKVWLVTGCSRGRDPITNAPRSHPPQIRSTAVAPPPRCATLNDMLATLDPKLTVSVMDLVSWPRDCDTAAPHVITVALDGHVVGEVALACTHVIQAPPRGYALAPMSIRPGRHELRVTDSVGKLDEKRSWPMPGLELSDDGKSIEIAEDLAIWVSNDELRIEPLQVGPLKGL